MWIFVYPSEQNTVVTVNVNPPAAFYPWPELPENNSFARVNLEHTIACHALSTDKPFYDSF